MRFLPFLRLRKTLTRHRRRRHSHHLKTKRRASYLPDDCWEIIFRFIINSDDKDRSYFNSLSLVSKHFFSITNRLRSSLTVRNETQPFLNNLLKRFTSLTTLDLTQLHGVDLGLDLDVLLSQISNFPLKLTSLKLPELYYNGDTIPTNGLRAFSENVTTLTSLTCPDFRLKDNYLPLIADCFPFLKQLNLHHPLIINKTNFIHEIKYLLSKCPRIQHLDLHRTYGLNVDKLSLFLGNLVSINVSRCSRLTESSLFSLARNCPSLTEIKMELTTIGRKRVENSHYLTDIGVYPQLKSLYLGNNHWLSDEIIIKFASTFPNLQVLDLNNCNCISDEGICQVLRDCYKLKNLNLAFCSEVKLLGMNFVVPQLEVLNLSNTKVDNETLYVISKNCSGLLQLLLDCTQLREHGRLVC